ncbi:MAG: GNAT family N-acetyltransferase [Thalassovita sp.]
MTVKVDVGFTEDERAMVAALYWQAFREKLGKVMGPEDKALPFIIKALDPSHALVARQDGVLLGVAGIKTADGTLVDGDFVDMRRTYGMLGALWRIGLLSMLERELEPDVCQMDGIFVSAQARGKGVGTILLDAVADHARQTGARVVRLDVIDTNPRAEALYRRRGFVPLKRENTGPLKWVFGFGSALKMEREV